MNISIQRITRNTTTIKIEYKQQTANIVRAIVELRVLNSAFVILSGICANIWNTFFKHLKIASI